MGDISKNFSRSEFSCKCGCGFDTVDVELPALCEEVREIDGGLPMTPSCGCRCVEHNKNEGGEDDSQHLLGKAADLPCRNPWHVYKELCRRYQDKYGFGVYSWGVHVDVRAEKARWVRW